MLDNQGVPKLMPAPKVVRPSAEFFDSDRFKELEQYLKDHWERAKQSREEQVDHHHARWQRNYEAVPAEKKRTTPWPGASNFVVTLIRMYVDTFVARTLNIIFATRPLFNLGFIASGGAREATEIYLHRKAIHDWNFYELTRNMLQRGAKNGTAVIKTIYEVTNEIDVQDEGVEEIITTYNGPRTQTIPYDDFYIYPITAETLDKAVIKFHRVRFVEEEAREKMADWGVDEEFLNSSLEMPQDVKRSQEQEDAGVYDPWLKEMHVIECHTKFALSTGGVRYNIIGLLEAKNGKLLDVYYHPYVRNTEIFNEYKPLPREDLFFGESWAQLLMQAQEEASTIHNDRRNNSYIANAPIFKRKSGSLLPNPSTNWYPGKVWDLESMDDFEIVMVGRNYNDMLAEENHVFMLAERIIGIGAVQQGNASGMMGKRGIYNASGTLAVLSESNQRQDTNIRDARQVLGAIGRTAFILQAKYGTDDEAIGMFPDKMQTEIREGLAAIDPARLSRAFFEIKASDAGANKEVHKANVLQMAQIIGQYGQMIPQLTTSILSTENPVLRQLMIEISEMHHKMAKQVLREFDNYDQSEFLPDIAAALNSGATPGGGAPQGPPTNPGILQRGGTGPTNPVAARQTLEAITSLPRPA
jgi:hypothetical protein